MGHGAQNGLHCEFTVGVEEEQCLWLEARNGRTCPEPLNHPSFFGKQRQKTKQPANDAVFRPLQLKSRRFLKLIFLIF